MTTNCLSAATLSVISRWGYTGYIVPAGITHTRSPATPGVQEFKLTRGGTTLIDVTGAVNVASSITVYNYFSETGFGYSS